ncbi:MAG TPA: beta-1,4-galactosyltransferase [Candidatus Hydrogenedentes bacterium]|nr:beta-1,4-galactosyltransferase [Candidatus Hydrogenedentota bacterium]
MYLDFPRLIHAMDGVAESSGERVVVQTGMGATLPAHCEHFDFKSREDVIALQRDARVIVCHGGIGSVIDALQVKNMLVVVPRLRKFVEHNNDHQLEIGEAIVRRGWGRMVTEIEDLAEACANPPEAYVDYAPAKDELVGHIRATLLS